MKAFEVFAIYVSPFLILGAAISLMKHYAVDLPDVQKHAGKLGRRFLLGAWYKDE